MLMAFNIACSGQKQATQKTPDATTQKSENNDSSLCDYRISFISKGAGIDYQLLAKYEAFMKDFEGRQKIKLDFLKYHWGREGETDYCFKLMAMDKVKRQTFVEESNGIVSGADRVNIAEHIAPRGGIVK